MARVFMIFLTTLLLAVNPVIPFGSLGNILNIVRFVDDANDVLNGEIPFSAIIFGVEEYKIDRIYETLLEVADQITEMSSSLHQRLDVIVEELLTKLPLLGKLDASMRELHSYIVRIDDLYKNFEFFVKNGTHKYNKVTINKFVNSIISYATGDMLDVLNRMYRLIVLERSAAFRDSILSLIAQDINHMNIKERLKDGMPQSRIFQVYSAIIISETKGFAMTIFSYAMLGISVNGTFTAELNRAAAQLVIRADEYILATREVMKNIPTNFERFDPPVHVSGKTYVELNNIQGFIVSEPDVAKGQSCSDTCGAVFTPKVSGCYSKDAWCPARPCRGTVYDCQSISTSTICEMKSDSVIRYQSVVSGGTVFGHDRRSCHGNTKYAMEYTYGFYSCDICFCDCAEDDADSTATRMISLMPQKSNIAENMVVVGVRLIKQDNIIHLQIREGKLLPDCRIDDSTRKWVEPERLSIDQTRDGGGVYKVENGSNVYLDHGKDYAIIREDMRTMYLDDLTLPYGYLITGVRFNSEKPPSDYWSSIPLQLEIHGTLFDSRNGTLIISENSSIWVTSQNTSDRSPRYNEPRDEVELSGPNIPILFKETDVYSKVNQYIRFRPTERRADAGQHTVPFFDAQTVETSLALKGIGVFHRGAESSGGFIALRIFTIDLSQYLYNIIDNDEIEKITEVVPDSETTDILLA